MDETNFLDVIQTKAQHVGSQSNPITSKNLKPNFATGSYSEQLAFTKQTCFHHRAHFPVGLGGIYGS